MVISSKYDIDIVERFVCDEKSLFGENSPRGIKNEINLALAYKMNEKYEKAVEQGECLLKKMGCWLEEYDRDFMHAIDNLAITYRQYGEKMRSEGKVEEANKLFERGFELAKSVYNISVKKGQKDILDKEDHFGYIWGVVISMSLLRDFSEAEKYCQEAFENDCFANAERECKAIIYDTMACVYMYKQKWKDAATFVKKVYELNCLIHGSNSLQAKMVHKRWKELINFSRTKR